MRALFQLLAAALLLLTLPLCADSVYLRGGEKLMGKVLSETPDRVVVESQTLGRMEVPRQKVEKIERDATPPTDARVASNEVSIGSVPDSASTHSFWPWKTGTPGGDSYDWIQLKSGEWLKGRMKSLQEDKLEFDSEKLDLQEFDWKDVDTVRLPRLNAVRFDTLGATTGRLLVTTNTVVVAGKTTNTFPRSKLVSVTPTGKTELNNWSLDLSAGFSFRSGNTRQVDYNAQIDIDRRTPFTHLSLDYLGNFGKINGQETVNNSRVTTEFDYFLSRRLFILTPFAEYYSDPFQNLDHRVTVGGGVGYDIFKRPRLEWSIIGGPAYQRNWFSSVSDEEGNQRGALALVLGTKMKVELTQRLDLHNELRAQITSKEVGETSYHSLTKLEFEIHKRLTLDISFQWDRISDPKTDAQGNTPLKNDFRLTTGLGVSF